jgi:hypothetical protein
VAGAAAAINTSTKRILAVHVDDIQRRKHGFLNPHACLQSRTLRPRSTIDVWTRHESSNPEFFHALGDLAWAR